MFISTHTFPYFPKKTRRRYNYVMKINFKNSNARYTTYVMAHIALFIVFFWFGILKVFGVSPAAPLVDALRAVIIPWWPLESFIIFLGIAEMLIGILFLSNKTIRIAGYFLIFHMFTTILPLFMLPALAWNGPLTPSLEGQYIIKNIVIMVLAASIVIGYRKTKPCDHVTK